MMGHRATADSIDEYIAEFPPETREVLEEVRAIIRAAAPEATETISYAIPTFDLNGKHPLDRPMPADLIRRIVEFRVTENIGAAPK